MSTPTKPERPKNVTAVTGSWYAVRFFKGVQRPLWDGAKDFFDRADAELWISQQTFPEGVAYHAAKVKITTKIDFHAK